MCFFFSFLPATIWVVIGYFVLFSLPRAEGRVRALGHVLAIWVFIIATFILLGGAYFTIAGSCPVESFLRQAGQAHHS